MMDLLMSFVFLLCACIIRNVESTPYFRITSVVIEPYLMLDPKHTNQTGNERYMGFIADLLEELSRVVGFRYQLDTVEDNSYGYKRSDGSWDGLVGQLVNNRADIAAAPMYNTESREDVVSFTNPFIHVYASMLIDKFKMHLLSPPISTARDLLNQTVFRYGTLNTGVLVRAFKHTRDPDYRLIWENMKSFKPPVFTSQNKDGINRVRRHNYIFILPSTIADYVALDEPCDLIAIDRFLMNRHFSLALKKDSLLLPDINEGLEVLRRKGTFDKLYKIWWQSKKQCTNDGGIKSSYMISTSVAAHKINLYTLHIFMLIYVFLYVFNFSVS